VRDVSDAFLLNMAEVSGGLLGLFVVGMLFYVETGFRRLEGSNRRLFEDYFRASTRIVLLLFVIPSVSR
jgi:heme/copper-type cytochrome/quinol oxidase subunit 2